MYVKISVLKVTKYLRKGCCQQTVETQIYHSKSQVQIMLGLYCASKKEEGKKSVEF